MKGKCLVILFLTLHGLLNAQESGGVQTIKVKKQEQYTKAAFDNDNYRLVGLDRFGNPHEGVIKTFELYIKTDKKTYSYKAFSDRLTPEMLQTLKQQKKATKIFFTNITVEDDEGHLQKLPDVIEQFFPDCKNVSH